MFRTTGTLARAWTILWQAADTWMKLNAFLHAGSLAFYTLFSMAPIAMIVVFIAGMAFGEAAARGELVEHLEALVGHEGALALQEIVQQSRPDATGSFPALAGLGALLFGATTVFAQLKLSLNGIWGVAAAPRSNGVRVFIKDRLMAFAVVLLLGIVMLASLLLSVAVRAVAAFAEEWVPVPPAALTGAELLLSGVVLAVLFAVMFRMLPDAVITWHDVWAGAVITSGLFVLGRYLIGFYLTYAAPASAYGAAGSLVLLLFWVYYSALILLFGAALTKAWVLSAGGRVEPRPLAVLVREEIVDG